MNEWKPSKVWYYGTLIEERCPICESPMPFSPRCYRCGYQIESGDKKSHNVSKKKKRK